MNSTRFVILHHKQAHGEHWDLMIERPEALASWRLSSNPLSEPGDVPAKRMGDHRKTYLEYEGPISGNRGEVRRIEEGTCIIQHADPDRWIVDLQGVHLRTRVELAVTDDGDWMFRPMES